MKAEADGEPIPEVKAAKGKAKKATPRKKKDASPAKLCGVKSGRVEKKKAAPKVKTEIVEDAAEEMLYGDDGLDEDEGLEGEI